MAMNIMKELIKKYNVPVPRYTSYPTVPFWDKEEPDHTDWLNVVKRTFDETNNSEGISIYIHLPFCESLCTYCGCNTRITKNHKVEEEYIEALLTEWDIYLSTFGNIPIIRELHLGGGTPTFFSPENLKSFISRLLEKTTVHAKREFSFEGHPNNTSREHLQALFDIGFRRVSYGIQDLDLKVQKTINRIQPFENVKRATDDAREVGYESVNFDLIYGLPYQTEETVADTIRQISGLKPDRIAYYSYAHVPWVKPGQRSYTKADLPADAEKRKLYELGKSMLKELGYVDIGMDHFALESDELFIAAQKGKLHRNFMGYTTSNTSLMIGLGTSSISDAKYAYAQNLKKVEDYKGAVLNNKLAVFKGHFLTNEDLQMKQLILDIACRGVGNITGIKTHKMWPKMYRQLSKMEAEGLLLNLNNEISVTTLGMAFIRNICAVFDLKLYISQSSGEQIFSKSI